MNDIRPNIWQLQSRHDVHELVAALRHPDHDVRKRAALALRALGAAEVVPALKTALSKEPHDQARQSLQTVLATLDQSIDIRALIRASNVEGLIDVLSTRHAETTIAAARALGTIGDRRAVEPLVILFQNSLSSPKVRLAAAEALLELQSAPAVVTLLGALRRDSWQVRRNAAAVLGQIQAVWAVDPLVAALQDAHPIVRRTAAAALRRIGTADAIQALRTHFNEDVLGKRKPAQQEQSASRVDRTLAAEYPPPANSEHTDVAASASLITEPPVTAEDTVPSNATRERRDNRERQGAAESVTLGDTPVTPLADTGVRYFAREEKTPRILQSVRRLIDFLNR